MLQLSQLVNFYFVVHVSSIVLRSQTAFSIFYLWGWKKGYGDMVSTSLHQHSKKIVGREILGCNMFFQGMFVAHYVF